MKDRLDVRRRALLAGGTAAALGALGLARHGKASAADRFEVSYTDAEWRRKLSPAAFNVLRRQGTEGPGSGPLDELFKPGIYDCAGCDLAVFSSTTKFDSGTGWPSFYAPIKGAVLTSSDRSFIEERTEVHCRRCGGHLGHVFNDGPKPTGLRYCMNGVALAFRQA